MDKAGQILPPGHQLSKSSLNYTVLSFKKFKTSKWWKHWQCDVTWSLPPSCQAVTNCCTFSDPSEAYFINGPPNESSDLWIVRVYNNLIFQQTLQNMSTNSEVRAMLQAKYNKRHSQPTGTLSMTWWSSVLMPAIIYIL